MSDDWINIRIGVRHFQLKKGFRGISFKVNPYCLENDCSKFEIFEFFGLI